jgi:ABC-type antimicrobial peptide transport system permease subunit
METMLFGIRPLDPVAIGGAVLLLGGAALVAAFVPALRASRIDPATALRDE